MAPKRRLYLIELFSGTKSVSTAIKRSSIGHSFDIRVLSVDNLPKFDPDVCADINKWKEKHPEKWYPHGHPCHWGRAED